MLILIVRNMRIVKNASYNGLTNLRTTSASSAKKKLPFRMTRETMMQLSKLCIISEEHLRTLHKLFIRKVVQVINASLASIREWILKGCLISLKIMSHVVNAKSTFTSNA